ncbi:MAG TPA: addiction module antitoxin [Burkholderiales bacterium]|nr:addiction module antitoxin [Burkholderiales bacterium]
MHKKMTITIDEAVYTGLHKVIGRGNISQFLESLARPHVLKEDTLEAGYQAMASDKTREAEAGEWCNALVKDTAE